MRERLVKRHLLDWLQGNSAPKHTRFAHTGLLLHIVWVEKDCFGLQFFNVLQLPAGKILGVRISAIGQV